MPCYPGLPPLNAPYRLAVCTSSHASPLLKAADCCFGSHVTLTGDPPANTTLRNEHTLGRLLDFQCYLVVIRISTDEMPISMCVPFMTTTPKCGNELEWWDRG